MERQEFAAYQRGGTGKGQLVLNDDIAKDNLQKILDETYGYRVGNEIHDVSEKIENIGLCNVQLLAFALHYKRQGGDYKKLKEKYVSLYPDEDIIRYIKFVQTTNI